MIQSDLRELYTREAELGEEVLQIYYRLINNYDMMVATMERIKELSGRLSQYTQKGLMPDTPEARRELEVLKLSILEKQDALEQFKSNNAVIKNSFLYLPRSVNVVLMRLPRTDVLRREAFTFMLRDALLVNVNSGFRTRDILEEDIRAVEQYIPGLQEDIKGPAELALRHAKLIFEHGNDMSDLLIRLSPIGKNDIVTKLEGIYLDHYQAQQRTASYYQLLMFMTALLMLCYAVYAYYRVLEKGQELRIAATAFETEEGIIILGTDRRIARVNRAFTKITGFTAEEAVGQTPDMLKSGRHDEEFFRTRWEALLSEKYWQGEVWYRHKDGRIFPVWLTTTAVTDATGNATHYVSVFSDITQRKEAEEKIHQLAFYDPLTNLPNRRLLIDRLRHTMASGSRNEVHGALLFIDLDHFKTLNDTQGHDVGDQLLIETARRLQSCVRGGDTVARLGGDEFVVMMVNLGEEVEQAASKAKIAGEKIRESLSQFYRLRNFEYHSSCSIGISLFRSQEVSVDELLKRADTAMYEAKMSGRNTVRFFDPDMQSILEARVRLEADLRNALIYKQFDLFYQVQVDVSSRPIGVEALLRWRHPLRGWVMPNDFIPVAEQTGLILPIGLWVLETACAQIKAWEADPITSKLQISVNVSALQFHQPDFVAQVSGILDQTGSPPSKLKLELTESVVLSNIVEAVAKMNDLKKIGVQFSMDDFGTGYSSLAYLTQLPLDQLKIDQSFVHNIGTKTTDAIIIQTIIGMAKTLGIDVIAEGVETEEQCTFLRHSGCMVYQGYLFGRPVSLEELEKILSHANTLAPKHSPSVGLH